MRDAQEKQASHETSLYKRENGEIRDLRTFYGNKKIEKIDGKKSW